MLFNMELSLEYNDSVLKDGATTMTDFIEVLVVEKYAATFSTPEAKNICKQ